MINYSILDNNLIFEDWEDFEPKYKVMELSNGVKLQIEQLEGENYKICQVLSSNPQDYLRNNVIPGNLIKLNLKIE